MKIILFFDNTLFYYIFWQYIKKATTQKSQETM